MRVFLTGGTGLIGCDLVSALLKRGDQPIVLTRDPNHARSRITNTNVRFVTGDPQTPGDWMHEIDGCQAVVNLAGRPVFAKRWNGVEKTVVRNSRVFSTWNVVKAIEKASVKPSVLVSTSAVGYYGDVPERELTEASPAGKDFMAQLCADWEAAARGAEPLGVRVAIIRVGVVLDRYEGALKQMLFPFKLGLGGPVGMGQRWMSWIHVQDLVALYLLALDNPAIQGPLNGTAPEPVRNWTFSKELASALGRPCLFPVPPFALQAMFGEVSQVVLSSQRAFPKAAEQAGFTFKYKTCREAMRALFGA